MQKFIKQIRNISEKIYDEIAGCEERYFQVALSIELNKKGINFLRETSVQFFYDKYPLSLFIFDFLIYPCLDLKKKIVIETKVDTKITDSHRQQLKNYLRSALLNNHKDVKEINTGMLINFKKLEKYKDGVNEQPENKVDIEVWELKDSKFQQLNIT